jgi:hypothetical protein
MNAENIVYRANLQSVGSLINESFVVLREYDKVKDWQQVKEKIISQNLLNKQSSQTIQEILTAIHKRFFRKPEFLPPVKLLAKAVTKNISKITKIQLYYPYICELDHLIKNMILNLVANKINQSQIILTKNGILEFLEKEQKTHSELKWSYHLKDIDENGSFIQHRISKEKHNYFSEVVFVIGHEVSYTCKS